jgi:hypothetical protein
MQPGLYSKIRSIFIKFGSWYRQNSRAKHGFPGRSELPASAQFLKRIYYCSKRGALRWQWAHASNKREQCDSTNGLHGRGSGNRGPNKTGRVHPDARASTSSGPGVRPMQEGQGRQRAQGRHVVPRRCLSRKGSILILILPRRSGPAKRQPFLFPAVGQRHGSRSSRDRRDERGCLYCPAPHARWRPTYLDIFLSSLIF